MQKEENSANERVLSIEDWAAYWTVMDIMQIVGSVVDRVTEEGYRPGIAPTVFVDAYWEIDSLLDTMDKMRMEYTIDPTDTAWEGMLDFLHKMSRQVYKIASSLGLKDEHKRAFHRNVQSALFYETDRKLIQGMKDNGEDNHGEGA